MSFEAFEAFEKRLKFSLSIIDPCGPILTRRIPRLRRRCASRLRRDGLVVPERTVTQPMFRPIIQAAQMFVPARVPAHKTGMIRSTIEHHEMLRAGILPGSRSHEPHSSTQPKNRYRSWSCRDPESQSAIGESTGSRQDPRGTEQRDEVAPRPVERLVVVTSDRVADREPQKQELVEEPHKDAKT